MNKSVCCTQISCFLHKPASLDDEMYDKSFIDDYGYIDRYTLSELGIEYSDAGTLHYFIFVDDAAYSRILQLFSNMHGGVADA